MFVPIVIGVGLLFLMMSSQKRIAPSDQHSGNGQNGSHSEPPPEPSHSDDGSGGGTGGAIGVVTAGVGLIETIIKAAAAGGGSTLSATGGGSAAAAPPAATIATSAALSSAAIAAIVIVAVIVVCIITTEIATGVMEGNNAMRDRYFRRTFLNWNYEQSNGQTLEWFRLYIQSKYDKLKVVESGSDPMEYSYPIRVISDGSPVVTKKWSRKSLSIDISDAVQPVFTASQLNSMGSGGSGGMQQLGGNATPLLGGGNSDYLTAQAQQQDCLRNVGGSEYLSRLYWMAYRRQMTYFSAWRWVAANADWDAVRQNSASELDAWDRNFLALPKLTAPSVTRFNPEDPPPQGSVWRSDETATVSSADLLKAIGYARMRAFVDASMLCKGDPLVFFDRTDYNRFFATSLGLPAPYTQPGDADWMFFTGNNVARGELRVRWKAIQSSGQNVWVMVMRGDSFGIQDSVQVDWSAIRLNALNAGMNADGIVTLTQNPSGS